MSHLAIRRVMRAPNVLALAGALGFNTVAGLAQETIPRWSVGARAVRYGASGATDLSFSEAPRVAIGRDSAVYVGDEGTLRLYEPGGRLTRVFGGNGQRAGEFVLISAMGWLGDTLWVIDE